MQARYARVDLTSGRTTVHAVPSAWRRRFVGGRGINAALLGRYLPAAADPLGADNVFVLGAGLLTGTAAPVSDRLHVTFRSPETGILGDGSIGGGLGTALRSAGFDHLVVVGRAPRWSYLWLEAGRVEVRDARAWVGLDAIETPRELGREVGACAALVAGAAGERLVRFASVRSGPRSSARCGGGAVLGSKLLKAIAAPPGGPVAAARPGALEARAGALREAIEATPAGRLLREAGTAVFYDSANAAGVLRTRNGQRSTWTDELGQPWTAGDRPEFSTIGLLGPNLGLGAQRDVQRLADLCNRLGLDTSSAGGYLAWALELAQRGLVGPALTGEPLRWGDADQAAALLERCAGREGFGNVLAEGSRAVPLGYYPPEALATFQGVKGLPPSDPFDVRAEPSFALGMAVASRGADHLRNRPGLAWFHSVPRAAREALYGGAAPAQAVVASEDLFAVVDSLGVSKLVARGLNSPSLLGFEELAELAALATGEPAAAADLARAGRAIADLERWLNQRAGVARADDTLPARCFDEPLPDGLAKGAHIDRAAFGALLDDYYARRGWDPHGQLAPARAAELEGLLGVAVAAA